MLEQFDKGQDIGPEKHLRDPYICLPGNISAGLVLVCDHADNAFPKDYGTLGLPKDQLERHIAYDIGVAGVTRRLNAQLNAPAILFRYSRLLIDPNRAPDDPTLVMRLSDGAVVPGNAHIGNTEIERRLRCYHQPYHHKIDELLDEGIEAGMPPAILSIHSFTENWRGIPRPWHATMLWDRDPRMVRPILESLRREPGLTIGENVPYTGELEGDCMYCHGTQRGLAHALIEIRQDLIRDEAGQAEWADRLARILSTMLSDTGLRTTLNKIHFHGSRTEV